MTLKNDKTVIINALSQLGGQTYPFIERLGKEWFIESLEIRGDADLEPALRWVNDHISSLYIPDVDLNTFQEMTGLKFSTHKGGFALCKRISRIMRPYFVSGFFDTINIVYEDFDKKIYDGAGIISRGMLLKMIDQLPVMKPTKRRKMIHELKTAKRVEFTIMTANGQDKGHAIVDESLTADFRLPKDTKKEVTFDGIFVGLMFPHSAEEMRIDIQSLINLHPFIDNDMLMEWLDADSQKYIDAVTSNQIASVMEGMTRGMDPDDIDWWLPEYFASGGEAMWFGGVVRALLQQHIKQLELTVLEKLRLPIPGKRYYIMVDQVGIDAGHLQEPVPYGVFRIDSQSSTVWCNAQEWKDYLADVLGGADQDDALWLLQFTDYDGIEKILGWRSPNQSGEYVIMMPDAVRNAPSLDSRKLPTRIDYKDQEYLNLVDENTAGTCLGKPYTIKVMNEVIERANANTGALGMYCNAMMIMAALNIQLMYLPAPLEDVIDASVKTGADLKPIKDWCYAFGNDIALQGTEVPEMLVHRLALTPDEDGNKPTINLTTNHWLDDLIARIRLHIEAFEEKRVNLANRAVAPLRLFQYTELNTLAYPGHTLQRMYRAEIAKAMQVFEKPDFELLSEATLAYLEGVQSPKDVLLGAIAYGQSNRTGDSVAFQQSVVYQTLEALREIEILDYLMEGMIRYPGASETPMQNQATRINGVWFNMLNINKQYAGMSELTKEERAAAKTRVQIANWIGKVFTVEEQSDRLIAITSNGNLFGYIDRKMEIPVGSYVIIKAVEDDGDLKLIIRNCVS